MTIYFALEAIYAQAQLAILCITIGFLNFLAKLQQFTKCFKSKFFISNLRAETVLIHEYVTLHTH